MTHHIVIAKHFKPLIWHKSFSKVVGQNALSQSYWEFVKYNISRKKRKQTTKFPTERYCCLFMGGQACLKYPKSQSYKILARKK